MSRTLSRSLLLAFGLAAACAPIKAPDNLENANLGEAYQAQYRDMPEEGAQYLVAERLNAEKCLPERGGAVGQTVKGTGLHSHALRGERLSRGDLVDIRVAEDETFSGTFQVSRSGGIRLPFLDPVRAQGRLVDDVEASLIKALVDEGYYDERPRVSVRVLDFASASLGVTGAVFEPRPVEIGVVSGENRDAIRQTALGASTEARDLANALRSAGGIRPDADLSAVELRREGRVYFLDLREVITGRDKADIMMLTGDELFVPSRQCFQDFLMVPSAISPPGVALFLSNLTQPATSNAQSAVGREVREVPYGTRYMQAVVDTNCVGGARVSSAARSAALYSRNPITGVSVVIEREIEVMMRRADRDDYDPYVLPGDSIACYDSRVTNLTEVGRVLGIVSLGLIAK